jgi:lysophospholipase L1-like esterase
LDKFLDLYRDATRQLAQARACPLVDIDGILRKEIARQGPESCILPDGVHLTARGNELVAQAVRRILLPEMEKHLAGRVAGNTGA